MKKISLVLLVVILIGSCISSKISDGTHNIKIYATNDIHGRFFDSLYTIQATNKYSLSSVSSYIKEVRRNTKISPILLDLGDNLQGDNSTFYYNYIDTNREHVFSQIVKYLKYDAIIVGNHDIETGHKVYDKIRKNIKIPYLAANAIDLKTGNPYFDPYTIIKRDGIKVAVIGMTNPNIKKWLSPHLWSGLTFNEILNDLEKWIKIVREKERPHLLIVAIHAGLGELDTYNIEDPARFVARNVKGIDVVFAAHDHKVVSEVVKNENDSVLVIEGGSKSLALSSVSVDLDYLNGKLVGKKIKSNLIFMENIQSDREYNYKFRKQFTKVKDFTNKKIGFLCNPIQTNESLFGVSDYLSLIHQVQLDFSKAEISIAAPLSLDVSIQKGAVNYQDLLSLYPFENQLYVINMYGSEIKNYLEYSYSLWVNTMSDIQSNMLSLKRKENSSNYWFNNYYFNFDSAQGIIYDVDLTNKVGNRVDIKSMSNGAKFEMLKLYKVAISSYRANGGGDLLEKGAGINTDERESRIIYRGGDIRDLIYKYFRQQDSVEIKKINHWKFVPVVFLEAAKSRELKLLFP